MTKYQIGDILFHSSRHLYYLIEDISNDSLFDLPCYWFRPLLYEDDSFRGYHIIKTVDNDSNFILAA